MHNTTQLLETLHQQTETFLQKAIAEWQMLSPEKLAVRPSPEQWSAAQCLEHLNIYGRYYLPAIEKAIEEARRKNIRPAAEFRSGWLGDYFAKLMRPKAGGQLQSKMKAPKNAMPSPAPDPRAVLAEFIDQQEKLLQLLTAAAHVNLNRVRIPISIAPWIRLKLGDTFLFVTAHIERHLLQAERALAVLDEDPEETTEGKYEVIDGQSVKMTADGKSYTMKVTVNGDKLQLEGEQDGAPLVIKADKRN